MKSKIIFTYIIFSFSILNAITLEEAKKIGDLIWQNETSNKIELIVFWNPHEDFPSLGIGHFIWIPQAQASKFTSMFPILCNYLKKHGVTLPTWVDNALPFGAPWKSREEFLKDNYRTNELRKLLISSMDLQVKFIIEYFEQQWPLILNVVPNEKKLQISQYFDLMKSSFQGTYALIDYHNFKGSGLVRDKNKINEGWGLIQVLLNMPAGLNSENINKAFALSAGQVLLKRIQNSYPKYEIIRFMHGWIKRISTYFTV